MKKRTHLYTTSRSFMTWLMAAFMLASIATRIYSAATHDGISSMDIWKQVVLPVSVSLIYALICLLDGGEHFYKTAIPIWMSCLYFYFIVSACSFGWIVTAAFLVCAVSFAIAYTVFTSFSANRVWVLIPILITLLVVEYLYGFGILSMATPIKYWVLSDSLTILGVLSMVLGLRVHPVDEYHPTWGDRVDGRRLRSLSPIDQISPYIMNSRNTANNLFEDTLEITQVEKYIRKKRREGLTGFGINHVLLACYTRAIAKYPGVNRFISGQKVYSHGEDIQYCMTIKKEMRVDSPDTVIKVHLTPYDTADDVYRKLSAAVEEVRNTPLDSSFDNVTHLLTMLPGVFLRFAVWLLRTMDYYGLIPKFLLEVSPFHGSVYFTSMGSLGIPPVYHHLFDFGNLPAFIAFGCKYHKTELNDEGIPQIHRYIDVKYDLDERIVDGYYYAAFYRYFKRIFAHPEILDTPPETVERDID